MTADYSDTHFYANELVIVSLLQQSDSAVMRQQLLTIQHINLKLYFLLPNLLKLMGINPQTHIHTLTNCIQFIVLSTAVLFIIDF